MYMPTAYNKFTDLIIKTFGKDNPKLNSRLSDSLVGKLLA